jgi:serine/threonine protein kinase
MDAPMELDDAIPFNIPDSHVPNLHRFNICTADRIKSNINLNKIFVSEVLSYFMADGGVMVSFSTLVYANNKTRIDDILTVTEILGQGTFGLVALYENVRKTIQVAVKIITNDADNEARIVDRLLGTHARYCPVVNARAKYNFIFNDRNHRCVIMNAMSGTLSDLALKIITNQPYHNGYRGVQMGQLTILKKIAMTAKCLLSNNFIYTDYKPANILYICRDVLEDVELFYGDLGSIIKVGDINGVYTYPPPEIVNNRKLRGHPADEKLMIWGIGITFVLMHLNTPNLHLQQLVNYINDNLVWTNLQVENPITNVLTSKVTNDEIRRYLSSLDDFCRHARYTFNINGTSINICTVINSMFVINPKDRISLDELIDILNLL